MPEQQLPAAKTKTCPHCRKEISIAADKCPFCQSSDLRTKLCRHCKQIVPKKTKKCPFCQFDSRGNWWRRHWFFVGFVMFVFLMILIGSDSQNKLAPDQFYQENFQKTTATFSYSERAADSSVIKRLAPDIAGIKIRQLVDDSFGKTLSSLFNGKIRSLDIRKLYGKEKYEVRADFNAYGRVTKGGVRLAVAEAFITLYTNDVGKKYIDLIFVKVFTPGRDKYGNKSDFLAYDVFLDGVTASRVNWNANQAELTMRILPQLWAEDRLD